MSSTYRNKPALTTICDLCGEEISDELRGEEVAHITGAYISHPKKVNVVKQWLLYWNPREWSGTRRKPSWEAARGNPRWQFRSYDMHTECIIAVIEHSIALRENDE